jgi:hypothetical protein
LGEEGPQAFIFARSLLGQLGAFKVPEAIGRVPSIASGTHNGHRCPERERNIYTIESPLLAQRNHLQATSQNEMHSGHGPVDEIYRRLDAAIRVSCWNNQGARGNNAAFNRVTPLSCVADRGDGQPGRETPREA